MKKFILILITILSLTGCKKLVEQKAQDAIIQAMTSGQWAVTSFTTNGSDITTDFTAYKFQFFNTYTVDAIKNGVAEYHGTWNGDANSMNITTSFPTATTPVSLLNGTWHIIDNSMTYVKATMTVGTEVRTLRLDKQ
jgi:hypothetical protein